MTGYTKLFASILDSSVWQEDSDTRCVWITLLAMAGARGVIEAAVPGIAHRANVSLPTCEAALEKFQQPDKYSRSQELEGRRLVAVPGGFQLVNHQQYRDKLNADERREYRRQWMEHKRAAVNTDVNSCEQPVNSCEQSGHIQIQIQKQIQKKNKSVSSEAPAAPSEPTVLLYPCVGSAKSWSLTQSQIQAWAEAYPNRDVGAECRKALAWIQANPTKRKTASGMPRFLNRWLVRAVDSRSGDERRRDDRRARTEPTHYQTWECPHQPPCDARYQCLRRTQVEAFEAQHQERG